MNIFSLRTIIDDILLIVRNNNISESEDLSRDQIRAWIMAYKAMLSKKDADDKEQLGDDDNDDTMSETIGPLELVKVPNSTACCCSCTKRTKERIPELIQDSKNAIISVTTPTGCAIQLMDPNRRHFHWFRRYTYAEPSYRYQDGYIYIEGGDDITDLYNVYVEGTFTEGPGEDEDSITIPGWMIPDIKKMIMQNELSFMLNRPSDDSNNSTLASVKPHGPQDQEK